MSAQELPEWARATDEDEAAWCGVNGTTKLALDYHAHRLVARMPKPAPVDPVRFALERVTNSQWRAFFASVEANRYTDGHGGFGWPSTAIGNLRAKLASILPVAERAELTDEALNQTLDKALAVHASHMREGPYVFCQEHYEKVRKLVAASLRASLSAYAPPQASGGDPIGFITQAAMKLWIERPSPDPQSHVFLSTGGDLRVPLYASPQAPRKVEVTVEAMNAFLAGTGLSDMLATSLDDQRYVSLASCLRAAFAKANEQAEARESEARAEVERLTQERDEAQALANLWREECARSGEATLRAHADKLEKMLTTITGVKLWESFEHSQDGQTWTRAFFADCRASFDGRLGLANYANLRQTPTPAAEQLKRWKIANADEFTDDVEYFVSKPMTRADAEKRGEVIGEAD